MNIQENIDLTKFNTFGLPAKARAFVTVKDMSELVSLLKIQKIQELKKYVLGGGSNILFTQDFEGLIIKNEILGIEKVAENEDQIILKIGAGENWHQLVLYCIEHGYGGIENLSLIAGTVGAAPIQNIGAYGVELKDVFHELEAISVQDGKRVCFHKAECQFSYRESVFKSSLKNQYIVVSVTLCLQKKPQFNTKYAPLQTLLQAKPLSLRVVSDAVIQIRRSKLPDPNMIGNAGSFFKNPLLSEAQFIELQKNHADIPHFLEANNIVKIPAGWLIEQCGFKGKRFGEVGVHDQQALVLVNYGKGTGIEIKQLAEHIQQTIFERFGIQLIPEVNIL